VDKKIEKHATYCVVSLSGRFTFVDHGQFKTVIDEVLTHPYQTCFLELSALEFIDSAGLGMLLILKDELGKADISLILQKPVGQVEKMLQVSQFDKMFTIEH